MKTIICLSNEVIEIILSYNDITIEDITNFRCVCKQFCSAAKYDKFMKKKLLQRWPLAKTYYKKHKKVLQIEFKENRQKDKKPKNFIEAGIDCSRQLRNNMSHIIYKHYYDNILSINFDEMSIDNLIKFDIANLENISRTISNFFFNLSTENVLIIKYLFGVLLFIDEIKNLLTQSSQGNGRDLIERYCNIKKSYYKRLRLVREAWNEFLERPGKMQLLELTAVYLTLFINPQKCTAYSEVKASLDEIAYEVMKCLKRKHPDHSIFSMSTENLNYWRNNNIDDANLWNETEETQIIDTLDEYIFDTLNFRPCRWDNSNLDNMCIDDVLKNKCGENIILYIIYHSVARRLGLHCDVIKINHYSAALFCKAEYAMIRKGRCFRIEFGKFPYCLVNVQMFDRFHSHKPCNKVINAIQIWDEMRHLLEVTINKYIIRTHRVIRVETYGI